MKLLFFSVIVLVFSSCNDIPKGAKNIKTVTVSEKHLGKTKNVKVSDEEAFELFKKSLNEEFANPKTSPLEAADLTVFKGLNFFPFNKALIITAQVELTPNTNYISLPTTTNRLPNYRQYALLHFEIAKKKYTLPIYQSQDIAEGYEDYLFLPFSDLTNDKETYGGGRYIDARIPKGDTMLLNFNYAYNPYCAYGHKYSCPKIPKENHLNLAIKAGVKKFH